MSPLIGKLFAGVFRWAGLVWVVVLAVTALAVLQALGLGVAHTGRGFAWRAAPETDTAATGLVAATGGYEFDPSLFGYSLVRTGRELRINVSTDGLVPEHSPLRARYEEVKSTFGSDHVAAVYVEDPALFTPAKLRALEALANALSELSLPPVETADSFTLFAGSAANGAADDDERGWLPPVRVLLAGPTAADQPARARAPRVRPVERAESLFSVTSIRGEEGWVDSGPLLDPVPATAAAAAEARARTLDNPLFVGTLVSADGQSTLITLYLEPDLVHQPGFDHALTQAIAAILAPRQGEFAQLFQIGSPITHVTLAGYIIADQGRLLPLACVVLLLILLATMRSLGALAPLLSAAFAIAWTLGLMATLGMPLNMLNYVVPALLVIIGATTDVHLVLEYRALRTKGLAPVDAMRETGRELGLSLLLTNGTTILGFASTALVDIGVLREFGLSAAMAMGLRFLATLFIVPLYLRMIEPWSRYGHAPAPAGAPAATASSPAPAPESWWSRRIQQPYIGFTMNHLLRRPGLIGLACVAFAVPALLLTSRIELNNDFTAFLHHNTPVMRHLDTVSERLSGTDVIYVSFQGEPGEYRRPERLAQLFRLEAYLRGIPEIDAVTGLPDFVALVNREFQDGAPDEYRIPENGALIAQYLLLFHPSDLRPYATSNYAQANLVLRGAVRDSTQLNAIVRDITAELQSGRFGPHLFSVTGHAVLAASSVDQIALGQVFSLGSMVAILLVIVSTIFLSVRTAALAVAANLMPIITVFGVMGLLGIPLNLGTCMIAGISIGIAVDDTIHLMVRYNHDLRRRKHERLALTDTLMAELRPVMLSSFALAGGFVVLLASSFVPVQQFGALSALTMLLALAAEMLLTPTFLSTIRLITVWDVLGVQLRRALMHNSPVLEGLTSWQAKKLIAASNLEKHPAGECLIRAGEQGDRMYVVIEGELEVSRGDGPGRLVLNRLGPGQVIGEVALVSQVRRSADVRTLTAVRLLALDWDSLCALQRFSPYLAARLNLNLARILGQRLADTLGKVDTRSPITRPSLPADTKTTEAKPAGTTQG